MLCMPEMCGCLCVCTWMRRGEGVDNMRCQTDLVNFFIWCSYVLVLYPGSHMPLSHFNGACLWSVCLTTHPYNDLTHTQAHMLYTFTYLNFPEKFHEVTYLTLGRSICPQFQESLSSTFALGVRGWIMCKPSEMRWDSINKDQSVFFWSVQWDYRLSKQDIHEFD